MRERFPKLGLSFSLTCSFRSSLSFLINCLLDTFLSLFYNAVNHLDFLGVQIAWVTGPWFLSIFMNMLPWESGQVLCCCFYLCDLCDMMLPIQKHLILVLENSQDDFSN